MFKNKSSLQQKNSSTKEKLFEDICLLLLNKHYQDPRRIDKNEIFNICEKAEEITEIIKTWEIEN